MIWTLVFTKQAQKDAKRLSSSGLKSKAATLLDMIKESSFQNPPPDEKTIAILSFGVGLSGMVPASSSPDDA